MSETQDDQEKHLPPSSVEHTPDEEGHDVHRSHHPQVLVQDEASEKSSAFSIPERWRTTSQRVRARAATLAEKLGRPHEAEEDGLDASFTPEWYGATDDLTSFEARQAKDEEHRLPRVNHDYQAQLLMKQMPLSSTQHRSRHLDTPEPRSGATTPGDSGASSQWRSPLAIASGLCPQHGHRK